MSTAIDLYLAAMEQRCMEFETVLAWVDSQRDNWPVLRRELATLLMTKDTGPDEDYRVIERDLLDKLMLRMNNEVAGQPATRALAQQLREEDEQAAREEMDESYV